MASDAELKLERAGESPPRSRVCPPSAAGRRVHLALLAALVLFAAVLRFGRLDIPSGMVFDEIYYAKAARQYLAGQEITEEITHPPLSKLLIAGAMRVFGDNAMGWRIAPAAAGTLLVPAVALLAGDLSRSPAVSGFAGLLVAVDGLAFVESRIAKPDIFLVLFLVTAYLGFWRYLTRGRVGWLYLSGAGAGLAVATKWTGLAALGTIPLYLLLALASRWWRLPSRRHLLHLALAYAVLPLSIYAATWIPYFRLGHSVGELATFHVWMFQFHAGLTATHPYQSQWWSWPLLVRPIWYEYQEVSQGVSRGILAIGNPILWWSSLAALGALAVGAVRRRHPAEVFVLLGYLTSYLPYAFIGRALFLYHMLPALPFMVIATAIGLARIRARMGAEVSSLYLAGVALWFVIYYPVLAALPIAAQRFYRLMWFGTWI